MVTHAEVVEIVKSVIGESVQCRASYHHSGRLRYDRGNPATYECECGKRYIKDGKGGLRDAPQAQ